MAQFQILTNGITTQVQVTVFHTQVVAAIRFIFDRERRSYGSIQYIQFRNNQFDIPCRNIFVLAGTFSDSSRYLNHILAAQFVCFFTKISIYFLIEYQLGYTITVTKIDKRHTAHLTSSLHPSG